MSGINPYRGQANRESANPVLRFGDTVLRLSAARTVNSGGEVYKEMTFTVEQAPMRRLKRFMTHKRRCQ